MYPNKLGGQRPLGFAAQRAQAAPPVLRRAPGTTLAQHEIDGLEDQLLAWARAPEGAGSGRRAVYTAIVAALEDDPGLRSIEVEYGGDLDGLRAILSAPAHVDIAVSLRRPADLPPAYDDMQQHHFGAGQPPADAHLPPPQYDNGEPPDVDPMPPPGAALAAPYEPVFFPRALVDGFAAVPDVEAQPQLAPLGEALDACCSALAELVPYLGNALERFAAEDMVKRIESEAAAPEVKLAMLTRMVQVIPMQCMPCRGAGLAAGMVDRLIQTRIAPLVRTLQGDAEFLAERERTLRAFDQLCELQEAQDFPAPARPVAPELRAQPRAVPNAVAVEDIPPPPQMSPVQELVAECVELWKTPDPARPDRQLERKLRNAVSEIMNEELPRQEKLLLLEQLCRAVPAHIRSPAGNGLAADLAQRVFRESIEPALRASSNPAQLLVNEMQELYGQGPAVRASAISSPDPLDFLLVAEINNCLDIFAAGKAQKGAGVLDRLCVVSSVLARLQDQPVVQLQTYNMLWRALTSKPSSNPKDSRRIAEQFFQVMQTAVQNSVFPENEDQATRKAQLLENLSRPFVYR
ncbi:MAG: hypothetical protein Q8R63_05860 [Ramlibacter sp.]|nr:hypothetical protein [Ramlibacter sp.]